jgi:DNA-binding ferritin-like protein
MHKEIGEFILTLLHAATNTHLLHLKSKNYPEHVALGKFYAKLPDLVDDLAENIQGLLEELIEYPEDYYPPMVESLDELRSLREYVKEERQVLPQNSEIQNDIDEICKLINKTIYEIKFLK